MTVKIKQLLKDCFMNYLKIASFLVFSLRYWFNILLKMKMVPFMTTMGKCIFQNVLVQKLFYM
jgi:hypothetical protein